MESKDVELVAVSAIEISKVFKLDEVLTTDLMNECKLTV